MSFPISMLGRMFDASSSAEQAPRADAMHSRASRASSMSAGSTSRGTSARVAEATGEESVPTHSTSSVIRDQEGALETKQAFLTLLVAQIKNQNPLNPTDGTEFLSQLAQFSELEQLISIREELQSIGSLNRATAAESPTDR